MSTFQTTLMLTILVACGLWSAPQELVFLVETAVAKEEPFSFKRRYIGTITTEYFSLLKPAMNGTIDEINIKADQAVKKSKHLFSLDNSSLKSAVEIDQKHLALAKRAFVRQQQLRKTNDVTKAQVDQAEMAMLSAEQKLSESKRALKNSEVLAPFDGIVGVPRVVMGQSVTPADTLVSIRRGAYSLLMKIPASRLKEIAVGQRVLVNKVEAHLDAVEKSIDPLTRTGFAKATLKECSHCIVGSSVFAEVTIEDNPKAIMLSSNAIFYKKGEALVVAVKTDEATGKTTADLRPVKIGLEQDGMVQIVSGVKAGDIIVKANPKRLAQDASLKVLP